MIFREESLTFRILDVLKLDQSHVVWHNRPRDFCALSYRLEADTVLSAAGEEHHLRSGDLAFVPAGLDYRRTSGTDRLIVVHFELYGVAAERIEVLTPRRSEQMEALFSSLLSVYEQKEAGYRHAAAALLHEIFLACYREVTEEAGCGSRIGRSLAYMRRHYADPTLTVPRIAAESYMSEVYFRRLFRREMGTSPQKYLVRLRLERAASLIAGGYHTLEEVASLSGYTDYKYFSSEFRRHHGVPPSAYRWRT